MQPTFFPSGDSALTVSFGDSIEVETNDIVLSLFNLLKHLNFKEVIDVIPAYTTLTIVYDFIRIYNESKGSPYQYMLKKVQTVIQDVELQKPSTAKAVEIPVCYDVTLGKDLPVMARQKNIAIEEIIQLHSAPIYHVYMIGFLPGFSYMGKVHEKIATPRKAIPETCIPAGSVGIAGEQTGIYPVSSPGGWNIIGCTPVKVFDAKAPSPCLLEAGCKVKFIKIDLDEYYQLKNVH